MQAAVEATREIGLAVLATTLSLVAIFVPVGFMGGIVGRFMTSFGFTMSFAILVSLLVSFTLTPMLAARWIKTEVREGKQQSILEGIAVLPPDRFRLHGNPAVVARAPAVIAGVAVLVLLSSVPLFMLANKNFLPSDDQSEFEVGLRAPEGTSLEATEIVLSHRGGPTCGDTTVSGMSSGFRLRIVTLPHRRGRRPNLQLHRRAPDQLKRWPVPFHTFPLVACP